LQIPKKYDKIAMLKKSIAIFKHLYLTKKLGCKIHREVKIMNKYESVIIVNPNVDEAGLKALEEKFTGLINENGKVESVENMGKKRLAYEIKKFKEGTYMLFNFESNPDSIKELERVYRITDDVIKFIVVRKED
jgi:small subunit ribosomal protein S6